MIIVSCRCAAAAVRLNGERLPQLEPMLSFTSRGTLSATMFSMQSFTMTASYKWNDEWVESKRM